MDVVANACIFQEKGDGVQWPAYSSFLELPTVDEVTGQSSICLAAYGEKFVLRSRLALGLSCFHVLVDLNGDSRKLVTADPSEYTEEIVFELF